MWTIGFYKSQFQAAPMTWSFCFGEMKELVEAVRNADIDNAREEWNDVCVCVQAWLSEYLPIDWAPILPGLGLSSAQKFAARRAVWQQIFDHHGVYFHRKYLFKGGNYRKRHKVAFALAQGGLAGEEVDYEWVDTFVGGFEG